MIHLNGNRGSALCGKRLDFQTKNYYCASHCPTGEKLAAGCPCIGLGYGPACPDCIRLGTSPTHMPVGMPQDAQPVRVRPLATPLVINLPGCGFCGTPVNKDYNFRTGRQEDSCPIHGFGITAVVHPVMRQRHP